MKAKAMIFAVVIFMSLLPKTYGGEVISSSVEKKDGVYYVKIGMSVNAEKGKVFEIFNNPEKLKKLSTLIKESRIIEKNIDGVTKRFEMVRICFYICLQATQKDEVTAMSDEIAATVDPDESSFNQSDMRLWISRAENGKTVINYETELKPKGFSGFLLDVVGMKKIKEKLIAAETKAIERIERMAATNKSAGYSAEKK